MRKIRMYRTGFGDCCCLRDRGRNLVVDFGTSNQKIGSRSRTEVFERIWKDLEGIPRKDLLLTGFLPAHTQGIVTIWNQGMASDAFGTVYLPDLFSDKEHSGILAMLLLADLLEESYLPGKQVSLLYFLRTLVMQDTRIVLVSRGDEFAGKYRTLWPECSALTGYVAGILQCLNQQESFAWRQLLTEADNLRLAFLEFIKTRGTAVEEAEVSSAETEPGKGHENRKEAGVRKDLAQVQEGLNRLRISGVLDTLKTAFARIRRRPQELRDLSGLCFQNRVQGDLNLLFTGDVPPSVLQKIMNNSDGRVPVYSHYWCIKVPHHGTSSHYFDFTPWTPDLLLISNGQYYPDEKSQEKNCRVSAQYAGLFYIPDTTMLCAEDGCCDGNQNGCTCLDYEIVAPGLYKDI